MDIVNELRKRGAYWEYAGGETIALLQSGKVSTLYANCTPVVQEPNLCRLVLWALAARATTVVEDEAGLVESMEFHEKLSRMSVCGLAHGSSLMAMAWGVSVGDVTCDRRVYFTEKVDGVHTLHRHKLRDDEHVFVLEDVITTGESTGQAFTSLVASNGRANVSKLVLCLINRSGSNKIRVGGATLRVIALADVKAKTWDTLADARKELPFVKEAVSPKGNWERLVAS